jgi:hypothetical protein
MSIFLLGAAPSLRADAHADCGRPILDGERRLPSAIAGADIPNDTVLQIKTVVQNSTSVYGILAAELPLHVERFSAARGDIVPYPISPALPVLTSRRTLAPQGVKVSPNDRDKLYEIRRLATSGVRR